MKEKHEGYLLGSVFYTFSTGYIEAKRVRKTTATQRISTKRCLEQCLWYLPLCPHVPRAPAAFLVVTHPLSDTRKLAAHLHYKGIEGNALIRGRERAGEQAHPTDPSVLTHPF